MSNQKVERIPENYSFEEAIRLVENERPDDKLVQSFLHRCHLLHCKLEEIKDLSERL